MPLGVNQRHISSLSHYRNELGWAAQLIVSATFSEAFMALDTFFCWNCLFKEYVEKINTPVRGEMMHANFFYSAYSNSGSISNFLFRRDLSALFNVGRGAGRVPNTTPTSTDIGILEL